MIKILLVDDHTLFRYGLKKLLDGTKGFNVVGDVGSGEEAIVMVRDFYPTVVLMDVKMPGIGGIEATRRITRSFPEIKVIGLSGMVDDQSPLRMLQAGATGYLSKNCSFEDLLEGIRKVASGQRYIHPEIAQLLALKHVIDRVGSPLDVLTEREIQIMIMITQGMKIQEISCQLNVSPKTINTYRYRIFDKLKINSDVVLTHMAYQYGIIDAVEEIQK